jgi:histone-lysine N-methyltransferase SETMAR
VEASLLSSQKEVQDIAVSRESDGHVFWDVYRVMLGDYTPPGSTINAAAYQETLKRLKEAIWENRPGLLTTRFFLHDSARPQNAATTMNLLKSWGWEIVPHPPNSSDLALSDFHLFPKMKNTSEVSDSTPVKMFKMKTRNGYVPRAPFFYMKDLTK